VPRRPDDRVVGDGVVRGIVQVVCPFVDGVRPGLDGLFPAAGFPDACHAAGRQDAQDLLHPHAAEVVGHQEVDQVADVRQVVAGEAGHRDLARRALRGDVGAGPGDVGGA